MQAVTRRTFLSQLTAGTAAAVLAAGCRSRPANGRCAALAGRRIRWIVPNAAGGGYDTESRLLQPFLEAALSAEILVVNMPGAGGRLGARAIADASPDGTTLGIVGMPGLLVAWMLGEAGAVNPARDLSILGRISRSAHVWAAAEDSPIRSLADIERIAAARPIVFAINEVGSANVLSIAVAAALLGVDVTFIPGFEGMRAATLAAIRGEVDLVSFNYETIRPLVDGGELRPVLQIGGKAIAGESRVAGVPLIGGQDGAAVRYARSALRDPQQALAVAAALDRTLGGGRIVVAPRGLDETTAACLAASLHDVVSSDALRARTDRALDVADAATARADAAAAEADVQLLRPFLEPVLTRLRS